MYTRRRHGVKLTWFLLSAQCCVVLEQFFACACIATIIASISLSYPVLNRQNVRNAGIRFEERVSR